MKFQNVRAWQKVIKRYYDLNSPIKFIITGPASLFLKDSADSLAGRIIEFEIRTLDFPEHCKLSKIELPNFPNTLEERLKTPPLKVSPEIKTIFEEYLVCGGFPEVTSLKAQGLSVGQIQQYIKQSIITKIISKDFKKYYRLKQTSADYRIYEILCNEIGQTVNYQKFAKSANIAIDTLKNHLDIFIESGLFYRINSWTSKPRKIISAHPKFYVSAPSLVFSYLGHSKIPPGSLIGHLAESYLHQRLIELTNNEKKIVYYKNEKGLEVDFYLSDYSLLLEAKFSDYITENDYAFLLKSAKNHGLSPWLITKSQIIPEIGLHSQPLALF